MRQKINWADKNGHWLGYDHQFASIGMLHAWVRRRLPLPDKCPHCQEQPKGTYDLTNKTGIYNRDLDNWEYLCRRCHMISDGRLIKRLEHNKTWRQPQDPITGQFIRTSDKRSRNPKHYQR